MPCPGIWDRDIFGRVLRLGNNGQENNTEKSKSGKISNVMSNENELLPSRWFMLMSVFLMRTIMSIIRIAHLSSSSIRKSVEVLVEVWHRRAFVSPHWWCIITTATAAKRPKALQCHAQLDMQCNCIVHCWAVHFNQAYTVSYSATESEKAKLFQNWNWWQNKDAPCVLFRPFHCSTLHFELGGGVCHLV